MNKEILKSLQEVDTQELIYEVTSVPFEECVCVCESVVMSVHHTQRHMRVHDVPNV